jgi:hypothetical protein
MRDEAGLVLGEWRKCCPSKTEGELMAAMAQWELHPYKDGDSLVAVGMTKGSEFHLLSTPLFKFKRTWVRNNLRPLLARCGFLTTRVAHGDTANQRFNKLFGFAPTWADTHFQYFILTELPFGERQSCQ